MSVGASVTDLSASTTEASCEVLYDREKYTEDRNNIDGILKLRLQELLNRLEEIEPIMSYIERKIQEYQEVRKYDKLTLVGSLGNKLYIPELMPDGTYQVEADILFERPIESVTIPVANEQVIAECPRTVLELDTLKGTLPVGSVLLKVKDIHGELSDTDRYDFLKRAGENSDIYLNSNAFRSCIPHIYGLSILGEKEISTFVAPVLQPLYRTFKSNKKTLNARGKDFKFVILMDKVASIKIPWPDIARDFQTRKRLWPTDELINEIVKGGCHLIHKPVSSDKTYMMEWRFTFSTSEQLIALNFSEHQRALFLIIKQIKRKYFDFGTFQSGESKIGLTTYHLKTVMLWLSESLSSQTWAISPVDCFIAFIKKLEKCLESNFLPHYFIPEINIFAGAWDHKHLQADEYDWVCKNQPMRLMLLEKIQEIKHHPEQFLDKDILDAIDKKHVHESKKEPVVEDYFGDLIQVIQDRKEGVENEIDVVSLEKMLEKFKDDSETE